jgi:Mn2+/Fe2+ NRAMP family transporter
MKRTNFAVISGAAFLMATSAIGPGFITQTTKFTNTLLTSFGFVIIISLLLDIVVQLNIWKLIGVHKLFAPQLAGLVFPGAGILLSVLVLLGAFAFNVANIAGAALGLQVLFNLNLVTGAVLSSSIAIGIFLFKEAGIAMDWFAKILGFVMIALVLYIVLQTNIPYGKVLQHAIFPEKTDGTILLTIVGGTVGGYISFSGIHRLLQAGVSGKENIRHISSSAVLGITLATVMRTLLYLAVLGVVLQKVTLDPNNPAATVFSHAAGNPGFKLFGIILWSAAITSVVGSAFTSISFVEQHHLFLKKNNRILTALFIVISTALFIVFGNPVKLLLFAGAVNGLVLPIALGLVLLAANNKKLIMAYRHPLLLKILGWLVVAAMTYLSYRFIAAFMQS